MLEAMSTGCRIVASDTEPVREVMEHERHGLLVDFFDHEAVADRVVKVLRDPAKYDGMGRAARARVLARYELHQCLDIQLRMLQAISRGQRPTVPSHPTRA